MPSRSLDDACSILRELIPVIQDKYRSRYGQVMVLRVGEVLRTQDEQQAKYAQGRTAPGKIVTYADGIKNRSSHQAQLLHGETCSHAVDLDVLTPDWSRYITDEKAYLPLIGLCVAVGLQSGGEWQRPDLPHVYCPFSKP